MTQKCFSVKLNIGFLGAVIVQAESPEAAERKVQQALDMWDMGKAKGPMTEDEANTLIGDIE